MQNTVFLQENFKKLLLIVVLAVFSSFTALANETESGKKDFNPGELIMHHISDSHEWHFATIGETHITLPLPVILYTEIGLEVFSSSKFHGGHGEAHADASEHGVSDSHDASAAHTGEHAIVSAVYNGFGLDAHDKIVSVDGKKFTDLSITKNVASMLISALLLLTVFTSIGSKYVADTAAGHRAPKGLQSFIEPIIVFIRDEVARPNLGNKTEKFLPYLLTLFFFILFNNLLGLLPGGANVTGNIAITLTLAVLTFLITSFNGNAAYWGHVFNTPGVPWWLKTVLPIMPIVEVIGLFTKPFSLMVRLFANITAGHIIILSLISLTFIFKSFVIGIGASAFATALNFLELLVAFVQAGIFTMLTASYIGAAVADHHHGHDHADDHSAHAHH